MREENVGSFGIVAGKLTPASYLYDRNIQLSTSLHKNTSSTLLPKFHIPLPLNSYIMESFRVEPYYKCIEVIGEGAYGVVVLVSPPILAVGPQH